MAQIGRFIDGPYYGSQDFAEFFTNFLSTGFFNGLDVEATDTMNITVAPGSAFIEGYEYRNTAELTLQVPTAEPTTDRIDRVVVRLDRTPDASEHITAMVRRGNEEPPELIRNESVYEISLAQILVEAGKSFIEDYQIEDERGDVEVCGRVSLSSAVEDQIDSVDVRKPDDPPSANGERSSWFYIPGGLMIETMDEWLDSIGVSAADYGRQTSDLRAYVETTATRDNSAIQTVTIFDWARARDYQIYGSYRRAANSIQDGIWGRWQEDVLVYEKGENANGSFVKYTDGKMECTFRDESTTEPDLTSGGIYWAAKTFAFPEPFIERPHVTPITRRFSGVQWAGLRQVTDVDTELYILSSSSGSTGYLGYKAEGRWR